MTEFKSKDEYEKVIMGLSVLPKGFKAGSIPITFFPKEKDLTEPLPMSLSLILLDRSTRDFAGVFTRNKFPGHPVVHGREVLKREFSRGVLINNKISNVRCPGGYEDIEKLLDGLETKLNINKGELFSSSTGIIGWNIPVEEMIEGFDSLEGSLSSNSIFDVSKGIMTTDNYPKVRSLSVGEGRIVAIAKGAGMIEPNMATMLVFILTDIKIDREDLREIFPQVIENSFNRISIDSDQSTSDTGLIFSSGLVSGISRDIFKESLDSLCRDLAQDLVRNGEGTAHVVEVTVKGCKNQGDAVKIGKAVVNAPLLKCAIYGNDPNTGRIVQAIGDVTGNENIDLDPERVTISIAGREIYNSGEFNLSPELESFLSDYLKDRSLSEKAIGYPEHFKNVEVVIDLNLGEFQTTVYGSDLSYEYVRENADYRS